MIPLSKNVIVIILVTIALLGGLIFARVATGGKKTEQVFDANNITSSVVDGFTVQEGTSTERAQKEEARRKLIEQMKQ